MKLSSQMKKLLQRKKTELSKTFQESGKTDQQCAAAFESYIEQAKANIPVKYWDYGLKDLTWCPSAIEKIKKYTDKLDEVHKKGIGLFLYGNNGLGKSLAAAIVLKEALQNGYTARWSMLSELLSLSSDGVYDKDAREEFRNEILEVDFLVVDDIGKTFVSQKSNFTGIHIDFLFRTRSNHCLPIIVTGNLPRENVAKGDDSLSKSLMELFQENLLDIQFPHKRSKRDEIQQDFKKGIFDD